MKTEFEEFTAPIHVFALPSTKEGRLFEYQYNEYPFHHRDDAVLVLTEDITVTIPAGIDLVDRMIATLRDKKQKVLADTQKKITEIDEKINSLMTIEYKPAPRKYRTFDDDEVPFS